MAETKLPNSVSLEFVEALYAEFLRDPESVPPDWRNYFQSFGDGNRIPATQNLTPSFKAWSIFNPPAATGNGVVAEEATTAILQERIDQLIRNYRVRGHMAAQLDPLGIPRATPAELNLEFYGLTEADMDRRFACQAICGGGTLPLREILERLRNTPTHLCRLRYFGDENAWSLAFYTYSHNRYEPSVFDNGTFHGTPEEAFDVGAVYLQDQ